MIKIDDQRRTNLPEIGLPHMAKAEIAALTKLMQSGVSRYLEFGLGGSTLLAVRSRIKTIVAVDSDSAWVEAVKTHPEIALRVEDNSAAILYADIGPVAAFGSPATRASIHKWPGYIKTAWAEWYRRGSLPELILVDGRFRVAACLSVVMAWALSEGSWPPPKVVVHDIVPERVSYNKIFEFFDVIEEVVALRVMHIKTDGRTLKALTTFLDFQFDGY